MERGATSQRVMPIIIPRLEDPASTSVDERDDHLMLLETARHHLEVEWTGTLAAAEAAKDHDVMGYPSMVAYRKHRLNVAGGRANRYVDNARAVLKYAATFTAWKHRQVSSDEAELLFRTSEKLPDKYPDAESVLLETLGDGYDETKKILDYWQAEADRSGVELGLEDQMKRRRCDVTRKSNGMIEGEFCLPNMEGETFLTALDALMPPPAEGDIRTTSQRRADSLGDLARSLLDGAENPTVGGERPHLTVHSGLDALEGVGGVLHETEDGVVLDPETVRQVSCDASVTRIVFGPDSEVLDVGRKTRVVPAGLRRAVVARDRHCVAPGCGRSAKWCDVHHIVHWADGGETVIDNLCLLCRYHHTQVHLGLLSLDDLDVQVAMAGAGKRRSTWGGAPLTKKEGAAR